MLDLSELSSGSWQTHHYCLTGGQERAGKTHLKQESTINRKLRSSLPPGDFSKGYRYPPRLILT